MQSCMREAPCNCGKKRKALRSGSSSPLTGAFQEQKGSRRVKCRSCGKSGSGQQLELLYESKIWPVCLGASLMLSGMIGALKMRNVTVCY